MDKLIISPNITFVGLFSSKVDIIVMTIQECWEDKMRKYIEYLVYKHITKDGNYYFNTIYYLNILIFLNYGTCK